jgi:hypothetical protein
VKAEGDHRAVEITKPDVDEETAADFVRATAKEFASIGVPSLYAYIAAHEDSGRLSDLSKEQRKYLNRVADRKRTRYEARQCFRNAQTLCDHDWDKRIHYHEGVTHYGSLTNPIEHGWNTLDGIIVDVTPYKNSPKIRCQGPKYDPQWTYCGVRISLEDIHRSWRLTGHRWAVLSECILEKQREWFEEQARILHPDAKDVRAAVESAARLLKLRNGEKNAVHG